MEEKETIQIKQVLIQPKENKKEKEELNNSPFTILKNLLNKRNQIFYLVRDKQEQATVPLVKEELILDINYKLDLEIVEEYEISNYIDNNFKDKQKKELNYLFRKYIIDWKKNTQDLNMLAPNMINQNINIQPVIKLDKKQLKHLGLDIDNLNEYIKEKGIDYENN